MEHDTKGAVVYVVVGGKMENIIRSERKMIQMNDDLISRQAAIDALKGEKFDGPFCAEYNVGYNDGIDFAVSTLSVLPSAQRWIPVSERLPIAEFEEGRKKGTVYDIYPCLVTRYSTHTDEPRTRTYVCKSYFDGEDFMLHGGYAPDEGSDTENTLAWMPLPERWEGGADGSY